MPEEQPVAPNNPPRLPLLDSEGSTVCEPKLPPYAQVSDYNTLREGDCDPESGKRIDYLVLQDRDFIVYLDRECYVHWGYNDERYGKLCDGAGAIFNRVSALESMPTDTLSGKQLPVFKRLIAEGVARLLDDRSIPQATQALDAAEHWLSARNNEVARVWYLSASSALAFPLLVAGIAIYLGRASLVQLLGLNGVDFFLGASAGAAGAWLSVATRLGQTSLDVSAGRTSYYYEGASKVMIGVVGAALVAVAIKANLLLGALAETQHPRAMLLLLCMVSGASERMVPNLVGRVGGMFPSGGDTAQPPPTDNQNHS